MESAQAAASGSHKTQVRRCARPGCADAANATLAFRYDLSQAWVTPLSDERSPATYDLCGPCADRTAPPRGWELVDERPDLDARAPDADDHDAVRDAIAAALRGERDSVVAGAVARAAVPGTGPVADFASRPLTGPRAARASLRRASPAPPLLAVAAPPAAERGQDEEEGPGMPLGTTPVQEVPVQEVPVQEVTVEESTAADVSEPPTRRAAGTLRSVVGQATQDRQAPRDVLAVRRRRPVEVLIGQDVTGGGDRSHAPVQHRLGSPLEHAPQTVEAAASQVAPVSEDAPLAEAVDVPSRPSAFAVPVAAVPLAFDALPDRLVSLGPDS